MLVTLDARHLAFSFNLTQEVHRQHSILTGKGTFHVFLSLCTSFSDLVYHKYVCVCVCVFLFPGTPNTDKSIFICLFACLTAFNSG